MVVNQIMMMIRNTTTGGEILWHCGDSIATNNKCLLRFCAVVVPTTVVEHPRDGIVQYRTPHNRRLHLENYTVSSKRLLYDRSVVFVVVVVVVVVWIRIMIPRATTCRLYKCFRHYEAY